MRIRGLSVFVVTCVLATIVGSGSANARDLWTDLRTIDGIAILYRHALAPGGGDPADFDVTDCATQRNLSDAGRQQARDMGKQLRAKRVPIARVVASPWCRSSQTAELMDIGPVTELARLGSVFQANARVAARREASTRKLLARHRNREGVLVLVGHQANIIDVTDVAPASGEGVVVRSLPNGRLEVLGTIPAPAIP